MKTPSLLFLISTFTFFSYITSYDCETVQTPTKVEDCTKFNSLGAYPDYCCLLSHGDNKLCKSVPYSSYFSGFNKTNIDGKLYDVDCGDSAKNRVTYALEPCGNVNERNKASLGNCKKYSSFVNSCCYFNKNNRKDTDPDIHSYPELDNGCYWLGSKYEGEIFWAGERLKCSSNFVGLKYVLGCLALVLMI